MNTEKEPTFITKFQIIDEEGSYLLEPYFELKSALYMSTFFPNSSVLEIEVESI